MRETVKRERLSRERHCQERETVKRETLSGEKDCQERETVKRETLSGEREKDVVYIYCICANGGRRRKQ